MHKENRLEIKKKFKFFFVALQYSIFILLYLLKAYPVTSFGNRQMGNGLLNNVDITARINNFYLILFFVIPLLTIIGTLILNKILKNCNTKQYKFMNLIAALGIINTILMLANKLQGIDSLKISSMILLVITTIIIIIELISKKIKKDTEWSKTKWTIIAAFPLTFFVLIFLHKLGINTSNAKVNAVGYIIACILLYVVINFKFINVKALQKAYAFFVIAPILELIYLELYNILNQHEIFLQHKLQTIVLIYIICTTLTVIYYLINKKKEIKFTYTKWYYPLILIAIIGMTASVSMINNPQISLFESANHGLSVYELFRFGKIPIIENFDAHMLSNELGGFLYGILNGNATDATYCIYNSYINIFISIIIYMFLKKIFSRTTSFFMVLFFPFVLDIGFRNFNIAFIAILTLINAYKKKTFKAYLLYWLSLVFLCLYKLDIGYAISLASVIVLIYLSLIDKAKKKEIKVKNIIFSLVSIIATTGILFVFLCIIRSINPINRAIEILEISKSNINWAYSRLGEESNFIYLISYFIVPTIMIFSILYITIANCRKNRNINIILLVLSLFYIFNFQRGMVRHSLFENRTKEIMSFAMLYFSLLISCNRRKETFKFIWIYITIILSVNTFLHSKMDRYTNFFDTAISKYSNFEMQTESYNYKVDRIEIDNDTAEQRKILQKVIDNLIDKDETFLDLTNSTLYYALLDKEKPVYVNQSPGLVSGENSQRMFINEYEKYYKDVTIMLKPRTSALDGVKNDYRYYLISENVYQNFKPMILTTGLEIWVRNDVYNEKKEKLKNIDSEYFEEINLKEYINENPDDAKLENIPYVWGNFDQNKDKWNKQCKFILDSNKLGLEEKIIDAKDIEKIDKTQGNYIKMHINSDKEIYATLNLYENDDIIRKYTFLINKGNFDYVIRTSSFFEWYFANINKIGLSADEEVELEEISVLQGDTLNK